MRIAVLLLLAAFPTADAAAESVAPPPGTCSRPIRVATSAVGEGTKAQLGVGYDLVVKALQRAGCVVVPVELPRARAFRQMEEAQIDIVPESVQAPARDAVATHIPHAMMRAMLVSVGPLHERPRTVAEVIAAGLRIDVVRGADYGPAYRALLQHPAMKGRITESTDPGQVLRKLMADRADATLLAPSNLPDPARNLRLQDRIVATPLEEFGKIAVGTYVVTRAMTAGDAARVIAALHAAIRDGEVTELCRTYYPEMPWAMASYIPVSGRTGR